MLTSFRYFITYFLRKCMRYGRPCGTRCFQFISDARTIRQLTVFALAITLFNASNIPRLFICAKVLLYLLQRFTVFGTSESGYRLLAGNIMSLLTSLILTRWLNLRLYLYHHRLCLGVSYCSAHRDLYCFVIV